VRRSSPAAAQAFGRSAPYAWILRGLCALFVVRDGKAPCAASVKSREIERRSVKPRSAALKGQPGLGRERHSEDSGRAFMGVNAACQRPGAERSAGARRSAFFAERGLTGRDPRAYPPATSEWLGYSHREAYRWRAYGSYFPKCFSESLRDCRTPLTVIFHRELCSEFAARVAILASVHYRTDAGQKPGRTPDSSTRGGNGPDSASSRNPRRINTFTRRAPYCTRREPISSRRPATALFSVVTNKLPKVAVQLPIGDDVSPSSPCEAWLGFDFQSFHSVKQPPPHWPLHVLIA